MLKLSIEYILKSQKSRAKICRKFATAAEIEPSTNKKFDEKLTIFRTQEENPLNHNLNHLAQFYQLNNREKEILFQHGGIPKTFEINTKTFTETCIMIREPALDIINCLNHLDYNKPAVKFCLYGKKGTGKSLSLAHIMHYAYRNNFLIIHIPWVGNWMRRPKDLSNTENREGFFDLNIDAAAWLLHFKTQNAELLKNPELKISEDIHWTKRESTIKDSTLVELIDHGINRIRFASTCVNILIEELKKFTEQGLCKSLVAIDGFNAFFHQKTRIFGERKVIIPPNKITLTEAFLNLTKSPGIVNSAIVVTVDEIAVSPEENDSQQTHLPRYLLGKDGFEHFDPFVPVEVKNYSPKEFQSYMDYLRDRKWISNNYAGIDDELYFLSGGNPFYLLDLCKSY